MARIVQKFGGTSVGDLDRIRQVAQKVRSCVDAGNQVAVVVSAMAGTTNQLIEWAKQIGPMHDAREYDTIVSTGYHEPSLVFSLGRDTLLLKANETALVLIEGDNTLAIVEDRKLKQVNKTLKKFNRKVESLISIDGYNLAKGQKIILHVLKPTQNQE